MKRIRLIGISTVALAVTVIACSADNSASGPSQSAQPDFGLVNNLPKKLMKCTPTGYAYSGSAIGPAGGTIRAGKHKLEIPRGALTRAVFISMTMSADTTNSVQLKPEGLVFAKPVTLTLDYGNCSGLGTLLPKSIVYTDNLLRILLTLPSLDDKLSKKVSAPLQHFSRYAVAY